MDDDENEHELNDENDDKWWWLDLIESRSWLMNHQKYRQLLPAISVFWNLLPWQNGINKNPKQKQLVSSTPNGLKISREWLV